MSMDEIQRYNGSAALIMGSGGIGMFLATYFRMAPLWVGFLAFALPVFVLAVVFHPGD